MTTIGWAALAALGLAGCASSPPAALEPAPNVASWPAALQVPAGQEPYASFHATGVQVYECAAKADAPGGYAWQFRGPEATLTSAAGLVVRHGAGPSWTAPDGSRIVAKAAASVPSTRAGAVPWLLLTVASHEGHGLFDAAASVQRVDTAGGVAPATPCTVDESGHQERVPYTATYVFSRVRASS